MSEGLYFQVEQTRPVPLDLSLHLPAGQLMILAGPSGAGKTSLLRLLMGLDKPAQGLLRLNHKVYFNAQTQIFVPPQARSVGLVFQNYALFPHLSALENIKLALLEQPNPAREKLAWEWLEKVRLTHRAHARPQTLSGGEQQRLALARALARQPELLLLDEPFAAMDTPLRRELYLELAQLRDEYPLSILLVTHELQEALQVADQLVLLQAGRILQEGPPQVLRKAPANAEVARLLGIENFWPAERISDKHVVWAEGEIELSSYAEASRGPGWLMGAPEDLVISTEPDSSRGQVWPARVEQALRLGQRWHLRLKLAKGTPVIASVPFAVSTGAQIWVYFPPQVLQWVPESQRKRSHRSIL